MPKFHPSRPMVQISPRSNGLDQVIILRLVNSYESTLDFSLARVIEILIIHHASSQMDDSDSLAFISND
jgi:hypothetical protein